MNITTHGLHWLRPEWLFALLPLFFLCFKLFKLHPTKNQWKHLIDPHLLPHLIQGKAQEKRVWPILSLALIWLLAVLALAGPSWKFHSLPMLRQQRALVIAVDMSKAMLAEDLKPNRAVQAKFKIREVLTHFPEALIGLVAFSHEPFVVSPLTQDPVVIQSLLPELNPYIMPVTGHRIHRALALSAQLIRQSGQTHGDILLLTANAPSEEDFSQTKKLAAEGFYVSVLGIGTALGAPIPNVLSGFDKNKTGKTLMSQLPVQGLKKLAKFGQGYYATLRKDNSDIKALIPALQSRKAHWETIQQRSDQWEDAGLWLLIPVLFLMLFVFRKRYLEEFNS